MRYTVLITSAATRDIERLHEPIRERIGNAINKLSLNPRPPGVKKIKGEKDSYRIRVGKYRVLYRIKDERLIVLVIRVGRRDDIYDKEV